MSEHAFNILKIKPNLTMATFFRFINCKQQPITFMKKLIP